jgi:phosphoadenosine phosphosulfate reductase
MTINKDSIQLINKQLKGLSCLEILKFFSEYVDGKIVFGTSLGAEDQILTHIIATNNLDIEIFTLDTGRLFPETYDLIDRTNKKYNIKIKAMFPDSEIIENMVSEKGINLFYDSVENRKLCCHNRKILPLKRALENKSAWITGLRQQQSVTRTDLEILEWDENNDLLKINPLIKWSEEEVWDFINKEKIPINPLHKKSYPSIGCQPCTRAVMPGEDIRAGRWWWENPENKECGLHK